MYRPQTYMNISSCYVRGWADRIKNLLKPFGWVSENREQPLVLGSLTEQEERGLHEAEQKKFDYIIHYFKKFSIFDTITKIFFTLQNNPNIKNFLERTLKIKSFKYDEVMKSYA